MAESIAIKVRSLEFRDPPFRKLGNIKIDFAERLTLIAGHNGIGKSTILGLVANTFGITNEKEKSYFGEPFYANIERIVFLHLDEVAAAQARPESAPSVIAEYGNISIKKRCAMTQRAIWKRARVVPRTVERAKNDPVGQDAKIPLPTIYLGIKRLASIGEADDKEVSSAASNMDETDKKLVAEFVQAVIVGVTVSTDGFTHQSINSFRKKTTHPGYERHGAFAVSMGQDSLANIATALASFSSLQRKMGDKYPGGLLVIDELDVGFHPNAIDRLVDALKESARKLKLQIIATTHSPRLIEAVHPEGSGSPYAPDSVVYLVDTKHPRLAEDQSLGAILNDMALRPRQVPASPKKPVLCVYFEDEEGVQFFKALSVSLRKKLARNHNVRFQLIGLGVGGSNLISLPARDPIFRDRILVVDADIKIPDQVKKLGNSVKLPCPNGATGTGRSPENVIKAFLRSCADAADGPFHQALLSFEVTNPSSDLIFNTFLPDKASSNDQREANKGWWARHWDVLDAWKVIPAWAKCYEKEAGAFNEAFEKAVVITAGRRAK